MGNFFYYLAAFALILGVLVTVHEYGHYCAARWAGVKVLCFSVGFGRPLWSRRFGRDGTEWAIGIIPLGGYVKMLDEREGEVAPFEVHRSFNRQTVWWRMIIVVAGPCANLLLAVLVYWWGFWQGEEELRPILGTPVLASPAANAGIENGERVLKVGGELVQTWQEMRWVLVRKTSEQSTVALEVINPRNEITIRSLELSAVKAEGWRGDPLETLGVRFYFPKIPPLIGQISPDGAAATAGLLAGDEILAINDQIIETWSDVVRIVSAAPKMTLQFELMRAGKIQHLTVTPAAINKDGRAIGRIGAMNKALTEDLMLMVRYAPFPALTKAVVETYNQSLFNLVMIGKLITGEVSWRNISGPLTIADYAGQSAKLGIAFYLKFMALVSVSLAVLNLLPIPILDGGHLLYYGIEAIRRKPLSEQCMLLGQKIGMTAMFMLMACAFYNDLTRLISG